MFILCCAVDRTEIQIIYWPLAVFNTFGLGQIVPMFLLPMGTGMVGREDFRVVVLRGLSLYQESIIW